MAFVFVVLFYRNPRNRYPADWLVPPVRRSCHPCRYSEDNWTTSSINLLPIWRSRFVVQREFCFFDCFKRDASHHAVVVLIAQGLFKVEMAEIARCQKCFKLCWLFGPILAHISTPKAASQHLQICNKCISSGVINRIGKRRKLFREHDASWYLGGIRT